MQSGMLAALGYLAIAGIMNSAYTLPLKLKLMWKWENMWLAFTILGVCLLPMMLAMLTIPKFWAILREIKLPLALILTSAGATWGVALLLFGLAVDAAGVAITFAIVMGTSASVGAVLPLLIKHAGRVSGRAGFMLFSGIVLAVLGVAFCGAAGKQRERDQKLKAAHGGSSFLRGFVFAVLSGICGSMLNFGLAAGYPLIEAARQHGASARMAANAAWVPVLLAGSVPGILYCARLLRKNGSTGNFLALRTLPYWLLGLLMGVLWFGSVVLYGWAALRIGDLGEILGWPLFMVTIVLGSAIWGVVTGEWKNAGGRARALMVCAVSFLVAAIIVLTSAKTSA